VTLFDGGTPLGSGTADAGGAWAIASGAMAVGVHMFSAEAMDVAGNVGPHSAPLALTIEPTTQVHWVGGSGNFNTVTDWEPEGIPTAADTVFLDAPGTYTVTASTNETVQAATVEAGARLVVSAGTFTAGAVRAELGGTVTFAAGAVTPANAGGVLRTGVWEASGGGSLLELTGGAVAHMRGTAILAGGGSEFSAGDGVHFTSLEASLIGVSPIGTLALLAGRSLAPAHGIADFGMIQLAGGTLTVPRLVTAPIGHVVGFGVMTDFRYDLENEGTIAANGGTLDIASAVDPGCSGVFQIGTSSVLEIAADQGAADRMSFIGPSGELVVDDAGKFGLGVGTSAYAGPLVENFASGDSLLLKNVAPAGLTPVYDAGSGLLQISDGSVNVASLLFDTATLGSGSFHIANSGGAALLTHS
jgi:hypothetical protein